MTNIKETIDNLNSITEILIFAKDHPKLNQFLYRITELKNYNDQVISLGSIKSALLFLEKSKDFLYLPAIKLNEDGILYLEWTLDLDNAIVLKFGDTYLINYVICKSSQHIKGRFVMTGLIYVLDMIDLIDDLKLTYLFE